MALNAPAPATSLPDPALAELFSKAPVTARRTYERNVDDLLTALDAGFERVRAQSRRAALGQVARPRRPATATKKALPGAKKRGKSA